ncbi:MAG: hypothetical protein AB1638_11795 [Nitrospirota bacterium]
MKKKFGVFILSFLLSVILSFPMIVSAAPPDNFTAKMIMSGMTMPMAKMGDKMRVENPMLQSLVTISLLGSKKMIMMSTVNKTYFEQNLKEDTPSVYDPRVVFEKKKIGSETIDGHPCIKYDTTFYLKDKPAEKFRAIIWEAQDLGGLPIRNELIIPENKRMGKGGRIISELREIKVGAAKASMFEVPGGYKKVSNMMEVMGGMENMGKTLEQMKQRRKK